MAVKDGQDASALKAEIAEKFGKLEEVGVFHDNEQVASHSVIPFFFHALAFGARSLLIQLVVIAMNNLSIYFPQSKDAQQHH